ncbi:ATP-binding protein [Roseicitreum antarcticum]|uniref:Serine/threonine-protein kinase RsbW n=1 Tax=Roseicitreum antarcticum TaxID=564137 RepID=A0A1H2SAU3_9RHOB|nr:ATP-binding protein [Roseicitreum antarcticum]SDW28685.1 serine/threonine-protein kinase RsbW [Roseicitreum antarcticum]
MRQKGMYEMQPATLQIKPTDEARSCMNFQFRSGNSETRQSLRQVCAHLERIGLNPDSIATTELVLAEVLNNIAEHACPVHRGNVWLKVTQTGALLEFRISDDGSAMPLNTVPMPPPPDPSPPDNLPEGGFGWYLIHLLTDNLVYQRQGDRNILTFLMDYEKCLDV